MLHRHRPGTADDEVIQQVLGRAAYTLNGMPVRRDVPERPLIIDAGAHIGCASIWFARQCPQARVIAIEPDYENHMLLAANTFDYDVIAMRTALCAHHDVVRIIDPGRGNWGYQVIPVDHYEGRQTVTAITMRDVLFDPAAKGFDPFICKIDIEGSEDGVFREDNFWIDQFPIIAVELHDWLIPGSGDGYREAMTARDRFEIVRGETTWSIRKDWLL